MDCHKDQLTIRFLLSYRSALLDATRCEQHILRHISKLPLTSVLFTSLPYFRLQNAAFHLKLHPERWLKDQTTTTMNLIWPFQAFELCAFKYSHREDYFWHIDSPGKMITMAWFCPSVIAVFFCVVCFIVKQFVFLAWYTLFWAFIRWRCHIFYGGDKSQLCAPDSVCDIFEKWVGKYRLK